MLWYTVSYQINETLNSIQWKIAKTLFLEQSLVAVMWSNAYPFVNEPERRRELPCFYPSQFIFNQVLWQIVRAYMITNSATVKRSDYNQLFPLIES